LNTQNNSFGPFVLEECIGRGGMCGVWRGRHIHDQRPVAIKIGVGKKVQQESHLQAFESEVRAMAGLQHPAILHVFEFGYVQQTLEAEGVGTLHKGNPYLVMELAERSLHPYRGKLTWKQLKRVLLSVLSALAHVHARGLLHRDIKPGNILVSKNLKDVKLSDFGLVYPFEQDHPPEFARRLMGTPGYMAPEQFEVRWREYGPWTDLYSFGCAAYALATGDLPFAHAQSLEELKSAHLHEPVPRITQELSDVPAGFEAWLLRLLEKKPQDRFRRAADAAWALKRLSEDALGDPSLLDHSFVSESNWAGEEPQVDELPTLDEVSGARSPYAFVEQVQYMERTSESTLDEWEEDYVFDDVGRAVYGKPEHESTIRRINAPPLPLDWRSQELLQHKGFIDVGLGLFPHRTFPLIDREHERDVLWRLLREVEDTNEMRLCLVEGATGVGKSHLVRWLCERVHEMGAASICRVEHHSSTREHFGLVGMVSRRLQLDGLSEGDVQERLYHYLHRRGAYLEYEELAPLAHTVSTSIFPSEPELRDAVFALLFKLLHAMSVERVVILWLEDVQWGAESLDFLRYLQVHTQEEPLPLFCVMTARREALSHRKHERQRMQEILYHGETCLQLLPLDQKHATMLLHEWGGINEDLATAIHRCAGGSPSLMISLVGDWIEGGLLFASRDGLWVGSDTHERYLSSPNAMWTHRILRWFHQSSEEDMLTLELAATMGDVVQQEEWEAVCVKAGLELPIRLFQMMKQKKWIQPNVGDDWELWSFSDERLRTALLSLAEEWARSADHHRICAETLEGFQDHRYAKRIGRHLLQAGEHLIALSPLLAAIWQTFRQGPLSQAQELYKDWTFALEALQFPEDNRYWGEHWLVRCSMARYEGNIETLGEVALRTKSLARRYGWPVVRVGGLLELAIWGGLSGKPVRQVLKWFRDAEHHAHQEGYHELLAESHRQMGRYLCRVGQLDSSKKILRRSLAEFRDLSDESGVAKVHVDMAWLFFQEEAHQEALEQLSTALPLLEAQNERGGMISLLLCEGHIHQARGENEAALRAFQFAREHASEWGGVWLFASELARTQWLIQKGSYDDAMRILFGMMHELEQMKHAPLLLMMHTCVVACATAKQDWTLWESHVAAVSDLLEKTGYCSNEIAKILLLSGSLSHDVYAFPQALRLYDLALDCWKRLGNRNKINALTRLVGSLSAVS